MAQGNRDHLLGRRHLEIQRPGDRLFQPRHVGVADVPPVLAQVRGDAVGAGLDRGERRAHRIGMVAAARIAQGGDVIDIDSEAKRRGFGHCGLDEAERKRTVLEVTR